jgi:hypothetical protein
VKLPGIPATVDLGATDRELKICELSFRASLEGQAGKRRSEVEVRGVGSGAFLEECGLKVRRESGGITVMEDDVRRDTDYSHSQLFLNQPEGQLTSSSKTEN